MADAGAATARDHGGFAVAHDGMGVAHSVRMAGFLLLLCVVAIGVAGTMVVDDSLELG